MKIILSDGTVIDNLTLNATTLVSETEVKREVFEGKMVTVTYVYDDGTEETRHNMSLDTCANYGDGWLICLSENPSISPEAIDKAAGYDILMGGN